MNNYIYATSSACLSAGVSIIMMNNIGGPARNSVILCTRPALILYIPIEGQGIVYIPTGDITYSWRPII